MEQENDMDKGDGIDFIATLATLVALAALAVRYFA